MRNIDLFNRLFESKRLELLIAMLEKNKYMAANEIRELYRRHPNDIKIDLDELSLAGILTMELKSSNVGKNKAKIKFKKYKVNLRNNVVKFLIREIWAL